MSTTNNMRSKQFLDQVQKEGLFLDYEQYDALCNQLVSIIQKSGIRFKTIVGIGRGGLPIGVTLSHRLNADFAAIMAQRYNKVTRHSSSTTQVGNLMLHKKTKVGYPLLICDDLVDEGKTMKAVKSKLCRGLYVKKKKQVYVATIFKKPWSIIVPDFYVEESKDWITFPYEELPNIPLVYPSKLSYLAALVDGEGTISLLSQGKNFKPVVDVVANSNKAIIDYTKVVLKDLRIKYFIFQNNPNRKKNHKPVYIIRIQGLTSCLKFLHYVRPYIVGKKAQADLITNYCLNRIDRLHTVGFNAEHQNLKHIVTQIRALNHRGV